MRVIPGPPVKPIKNNIYLFGRLLLLPQFIINSPLWVWLCRPDGFHADITFLEEKLMKWIRRKKMNVLTFTVISKQQLTKALHLGVDGIIMDTPL